MSASGAVTQTRVVLHTGWAVFALLAAGCTGVPSPPVDRGATTSASESASPSEVPASSVGAEPAWAIQRADGRSFIQVMTDDGANLRSVAPDADGGDQTNPDWSPDGEQLTFVMTDPEGHDDLWTVGVDDGGPKALLDCADACDYVDDPAWSPDGKVIAACLMQSKAGRHLGSLVSVDVATGKVATLFTPSDRRDFCAGARWSPDGDRIVLELVRRSDTKVDSEVTGVSLAIVDLSGGRPRPSTLTDPRLFAATADWSPDGAWIVYAALPTAKAKAPDLFLIRPDGSERTRLTRLGDEGISVTEPAFDNDSTSVVFVTDNTPALRRVTLSDGTIDAAFANDVQGNHPRARPKGR